MEGFNFSKYEPQPGKTKFEQLLDLFMQLLPYTSGDAEETLRWMMELDKQFHLTDENYGMGDFIQDLKDNGYLKEDPAMGTFALTAKSEQTLRQKSLEEIFSKLKKSKNGDHPTKKPGLGDEISPDTRSYQFGDKLEQIDFTQSIRTAQINHGLDHFELQENDLQIRETDYKAQTSTVLMIDISHSMILYGEDRITPAKKWPWRLAN
ncbi:vWA domain-containing protein [Arachidicoccus ginsenosidivorans]|uniref:hypothetical protein n=1 Tax=Arachidicoccus ginsenosidivorans TaxID=496057 RepID=UPI001CEF77DD|nr:hypothetical protein [Arachidicoccus ginsenosidivorans]